MKIYLTALLLGLSCLAFAASPYTAAFERSALTPRSMGVMTFGPDGILFVGDSIAGKVYALDLEDRTPGKIEKAPRMYDLEGLLGAALGVPATDIMVHEMAVNPISYNTYFTVSRGRSAWKSSFEFPNDIANADQLVRMTPSGKIELVSLKNVSHSTYNLPNPITPGIKHRWKDAETRVDAISDMIYQKGKLYVAGLSNEEFASTLRMLPFPFNGKGKSSAVEVYHGAHGEYETHAPIRTMVPYTLNGKDYVVAAYLCTPLALFEEGKLVDGAKVRGLTIAELGSGNSPIDMVHIKSKGKDLLLMANTNRTLMLFQPADIEKAASGEGINEQIEHRAGVSATELSGIGIQQMDMLSDKYLQIAQRLPSGKMALYAIPTDRF